MKRLIVAVSLLLSALFANAALAEKQRVELKDTFPASFHEAKENKPLMELLEGAWSDSVKREPEGAIHYFLFGEIAVDGDLYVISQYQSSGYCRPNECAWKIITTNADYEPVEVGDKIISCGGTVPVYYEKGQVTFCETKVPLR